MSSKLQSKSANSSNSSTAKCKATLQITKKEYEVTSDSAHMSSIGLDIHEALIVGCYQRLDPERRCIIEQEASTGTTKSELTLLISWILENCPEVILMESTGVYWQALYDMLEDIGLDGITHVVNARDVKAIKGKKSDRIDAARLATVARMGNVHNSFIPSREIRVTREISRHILCLTKQRQKTMNRMHRLLNKIGARFTQVFSKITGVAANIVLQAVIDDTPRHQLKKIIEKSCKRVRATFDQIYEAVDIVNSDPVYKVLLQDLQLECEDFTKRIDRLEVLLDNKLLPYVDVIQRLTTIPGISEKTARTMISELGADWSAFESSKRLASWAGLSPGNNQSAGKNYSSATTKGNKYIKTHLVQAANAIGRMKSGYLHTFFQSIKERRGYKKAVIATAHKLIKIMFAMLRDGTEYKNVETVRLEKQRIDRAIRASESLAELGFNADLSVFDSVTGEVIVDTSTSAVLVQNLKQSFDQDSVFTPAIGFSCLVNTTKALFSKIVDFKTVASESDMLKAKQARLT